MVNWYKHDIPAWMDSTESLSHEAYRVHHIICQLIYLNEGPIAVNERGIAGRCNMHILAFRKALDHLLSTGKLTLNPNQTLSQPRADLELERIGQNRVNAGLGGYAKANSLKNNNMNVAPLEDTSAHKTRLEKTIEEKKESDPVAKATRTKVSSYSEEFESKFWQPYPRSPTMSKTEAWKAWQKLTPEEQKTASAAVEPYRQSMKSKPDYVVHACRFLTQRRFDGFAANGTTLAPVFDIRAHLS